MVYIKKAKFKYLYAAFMALVGLYATILLISIPMVTYVIGLSLMWYIMFMLIGDYKEVLLHENKVATSRQR